MTRCLLSGAYPTSVVSPVRRASLNTKAQVIGKIFHRQMEEIHQLLSHDTFTAAEFRAAFNSVVEQIATKVENDKTSQHLGDIKLWAATDSNI